MSRRTIRRRSTSLPRVVAALAAASLLLAFVPLVAPIPAGAAPAKVIDSLPRFPADAVEAFGSKILPSAQSDTDRSIYGGTLVAVPSVNQLWQIYPVPNQSLTAVAVRDFDTLKIVKAFAIPTFIKRLGVDSGGDWLHTIDGTRRIFFLDSTITKVVEVDLKTFATKVSPLPNPFTIAPGRAVTGLGPASLDYDPRGDALFLLYGGPGGTSAAQVTTQLMRFDLKTGAGSARPLRVCNGQLTPQDAGFTSQFESIFTHDYAYFVCQRAGSIGAVVRIAWGDLQKVEPTDELVVVGPVYLETALADPLSGRIFLMTVAGEIWVFNVHTMAFVGVISAAAETPGIDPRVGYGVDRESGRLFFLSSNFGLGVAEGRFFPIPQARTHPELKAPGQERLIGDAGNGRLFVMTGLGSVKRGDAWTIYDIGRAPQPPAPPDPDANTTNVDEQAGVTQPRYFGSGTGYGVRVLLAKGFSAVPPAPALGQVAPTAQVIATNLNSACGFSDREMVSGRVASAEYETGSTSARATGIDVDERTKLDLAHLARCDVTARNGAQSVGLFATVPQSYKEKTPEYDKAHDWVRQAAACTSSEGGEPEQGASRFEEPSSASVACPVPGGRLDANAIGYLSGPVSVGKSSTHTTILKDKRGIVSDVVSEAQDIDIAGVVRIGEVTSRATSSANGRPIKSGKMSSYNVVVKGVHVLVPPEAVLPEGIADRNDNDVVICKDVCDLDFMTQQLNLLMGGRIEFKTRSGLDEGLEKGSARGAQTAIQKSAARQASDQALVGDRTTEVAALEMVVYNDNKPFGRARQIYQFAGVATAATYNIMRLPSGFGFDDVADDGGGFDDADLQPGGGEGEFQLPDVSDLPDGSAISSDGGSGGGGIAAAVLRALGRGIRMFFTDPRQALLLLTAWALFSLPAVLTRRRRLLRAARAD